MIDQNIQVPGGKVWVRSWGTGIQTPIVVLHGGPGCPSDYLFSLSALAQDRTLSVYDQLGCGRSDKGDISDYNCDRYVNELKAVLDELNYDEVILIGHSWGSMLAVEAAVRWPERIKKMLLISPCLSMKRTCADMERLRAQLPDPVQSTLTRLENLGQESSPAYQVAALVFYQRHLCRLEPWPESLMTSTNNWGTDVYQTMWGPAEFNPTGSLKTYEREEDISSLTMPILFACGRYDEITPEATQAYCDKVTNGQLHIFESSAHVPHIEQPQEFIKIAKQFIIAGE